MKIEDVSSVLELDTYPRHVFDRFFEMVEMVQVMQITGLNGGQLNM